MEKIGFTAKTNKNKSPLKISQTLVIQPPRRSSIGIDNFKSAVRSADYGRRHLLYELYEEFLRDPVLSNAIERRVMAITNTEILFQKDDNEVEEITVIIESQHFEELIAEIIYTKIFGKTVVELDFVNGLQIASINRKHLNTKTKEILANISDTFGYSYENDDFLLNLGKDDDLGLLLKVAPYAIYKRNGMGDFAQFTELFGIDTLVGLYDPDDESGRQEMEDAFKKRGSGGSMTMSKNGDVKTIGTKSPSTVDIHDRFLAKCDEQILIGILGQTMTTKDGSSLSQSKTHAQTEDDINQADRRYVQRVLNQELIPRLEKRGFPVAGGKFVFAEKGENLSKKEQLDIALAVDEKTTEGVDDGYFYETFGLPKGSGKTDLNTPTKKNKQNQKPTEEEDEPEEDKKKKRVKKEAKKLSLYNRIKDFFGDAPR